MNTTRSSGSAKAAYWPIFLIATLPLAYAALLPRPHANAGSQEQGLFGTYFLTGQGFTSKLIMQNNRIDVPITVTTTLLVEVGRQIELEPLTVQPNEAAVIDLNQALNDRGESKVTSGGLVLRYAFSQTGAINAAVVINQPTEKLSLMSPLRGHEDFGGNTQQGVFWLPDKQTQAFLAVQNTSSERRRVTLTVLARGEKFLLDEVTLLPRETSFLDLTKASKEKGVQRGDDFGAAIQLTHNGAPGDVMAEGGLINRVKGFSKRISFTDSSLTYYDKTLRANFVFLGEQPPELGFPAQVSFRSVAVMANTSRGTIHVLPTVKYLSNGRLPEAKLQEIALGPNEVATLDLFEAQRRGAIPSQFHMGTLELTHDGPAGALVAELTNLDLAGGYVLGSSFSGHPSRGAGGTFWRTDRDWQTLITFTNAASTDDLVNVEFFYEGGSYRPPAIAVTGGSVVTLNVRELQSTQARDSAGSVLPLTVTSGSFSVKGSNGSASAISMERLIFNSRTSECIVVDGGSSVYVVSLDLDTYYADNTNPNPLQTTAYWSDASTTDETYYGGYSANNTLVAQVVSGPGMQTYTTQPDGSQGNVQVSLRAPGCSTGSFRTFFSIINVSIKVSSHKLYFVSATGCDYFPTCTGTCSKNGRHALPGAFPGGICPPFLFCADAYITTPVKNFCFIGICVGRQFDPNVCS